MKFNELVTRMSIVVLEMLWKQLILTNRHISTPPPTNYYSTTTTTTTTTRLDVVCGSGLHVQTIVFVSCLRRVLHMLILKSYNSICS